MCGGTEWIGVAGDVAQGLSPRVRGNRDDRGFGGCAPGSIPACAGEPNRETDLDSGVTVYPRVCGGTPRR